MLKKPGSQSHALLKKNVEKLPGKHGEFINIKTQVHMVSSKTLKKTGPYGEFKNIKKTGPYGEFKNIKKQEHMVR